MWLLLAGFVLGLIKETCVVLYYKAVQKNRVYRGTGLTLLMGVLDFAVIAKLALDRELGMVIGYILGETLGTFAVLRTYKRRTG
jgi:hypothetical protein